jgi:hypothetical protein
MRILWVALASARRNFIASKALANDPFLSRLWHYHLFWICSFIKSATTIQAKGFCGAVYRRYCRIVDRLFGGNRESQYDEALRKRFERCEAKLREVMARRQANRLHNQQYMAALSQVQTELEKELQATLQGKVIARDPSTYS